MALVSTRTCVTYFNQDDVDALQEQARHLESDLQRRAPFIPSDLYCDGLDRIEAVRLAIKRLGDIVPE